MCGCHDPAVFGHRHPCPLAAPVPSRVYADKHTGQGFVIVATGSTE